MPAENVIIEGHFEINKYTVRYEVDGALYGEEESYDFGEMVEIRDCLLYTSGQLAVSLIL